MTKLPKPSSAVPVAEERRVRKLRLALPVRFTLHERLEFGDRLVRLADEQTAVEAVLAQAKLDAKLKLERIESDRSEVVSKLRTGSEDRAVDVEEVTDFRADRLTRTRLDTGEEYLARPLSHDERQTALALVPEADEAPAAQ